MLFRSALQQAQDAGSRSALSAEDIVSVTDMAVFFFFFLCEKTASGDIDQTYSFPIPFQSSASVPA